MSNLANSAMIIGKKFFYSLFVSIFLLVPFPSRADVFTYVWDDIKSPITTPARTPLLIGAGVTGLLYIFRAQISYPLQRITNEHKPLGKFSGVGYWAGNSRPNMIYAGLMLGSAAFGDTNGLSRAEQMIFGTIYSGLLTNGIKEFSGEGRPNAPNDKKSFPSGHATVAFAFAGVVGAEHEIWWAIPAYGLATLTAYSRMNDNKHYLHDVVGGATIGLAYALGVHYVRRQKVNLADRRGWNFQFAPLDGERGILLSARVRF